MKNAFDDSLGRLKLTGENKVMNQIISQQKFSKLIYKGKKMKKNEAPQSCGISKCLTSKQSESHKDKRKRIEKRKYLNK